VNKLAKTVRRFVKQDDGAALVEYGLLVLLIALVAIVAVKLTGTKVNSAFNNIQGNLP
jgi:pilus assembly protein Flp/PilA